MRKTVQYSIAGALSAGAFAVLYWFNPLDTPFFPKCPLNVWTGLYCPGCGSLRALHQLFHGNVRGALMANSLLVISFPFLGLLLLCPQLTKKKWVPWFAFAVLVLYGIMRNIPVEPFTILAPH